MPTISLLGSTGSIGRQSLDVIAACGMSVAAISANSSVDLLEEQARRFHPTLAVAYDEKAARELKLRLADTEIRVASGMDGLIEAATLPEADTVITSGGQQGLDLACKVLCNRGDTVICENPSFIGALNAFRSYGVNLKGLDVGDDGINPEELENILKTDSKVKMIYLIPTFQNPAGITMSLEKRKAVLALAKKYGVVIVEDNPYGELRFSGKDVPTIKSMDDEGVVLYCGSFSKVLSAGMRVGFICGHEELVQKIVVVKQTNDVHTNLFFQMLCSRFIEKYGLDEHVRSINALYGENCAFMLECMDKTFPKTVRYTRPEGGLFLWVTLPAGTDMKEFIKRTVAAKVAVVPGETFLPEPDMPCTSFRMNYSMPTKDQIEKGVNILAGVIKDMGI